MDELMGENLGILWDSPLPGLVSSAIFSRCVRKGDFLFACSPFSPLLPHNEVSSRLGTQRAVLWAIL